MARRYPLCRSPKPVWRQACSTPYALPARIALAVVSAVLTASNTLTLQSRVHGYAPEVIQRAAGWLGAGNMPQAAALLPDFPSGCCARAMTLLIRYCLAGWRSSPCCAP